MNNTLLVYGTRKGTTTDTVQTIAEVLRSDFNHSVDICGSDKLKLYKKRRNEFDNIIIGSSVVSGRWKSRVLSFAKKDQFGNKNVAVFVTAGGTLNKVQKYGMTKQDAVDEAIQKYIEKYSGRFKFTPVSKAAFGGKVVKKKGIKYNNWDKSDIEAWAKELGIKFGQAEITDREPYSDRVKL